MLLLMLLLLLIDASGFGILRTIEALSQRVLLVCSMYGIGRRMYGIGHGQKRRCLEGQSRVCRSLKSGKVHGSKLFAHARSNLDVVLVNLSAAFLQENFIQCCIHGILKGRHVHGIRTTSAVETWRRGVWRLVWHGKMPAMR
jgi:hypothetical protein